ncbi:MAG: acyl-CoA dehydrogenase family protein [Comamonadaceae bacterium]|nr:acyl-CoA dehydrogenase family protein [Comamonadaceae bacterium]
MSAQALLYQPPLQDMHFVIEHWLDAPAHWRRMPAFQAIDGETLALSTQAMGRFCTQVLAPLNHPGDAQGCTLQDGRVRTPEGFAAAYQTFVQDGWPTLACDPAWGGQGLPQLWDAVLHEMLPAANHAWAMYPGLLHGAYACLRAHASDELRQAYLPHIVSGRWLATMCLTEPQAGSDLGLLRTQALPHGDGSFTLHGQKIFITGGDQDMSENIVHLVLARLPDAPAGSKGLSLFLVPHRLGDDLKQANGVFCDGIEKKMGIKGSATCALRFEHARGWLIGQPNKGLAAMFVMMNSARLHVGLQGLGHTQMACQLAHAYAAERRQMRAQPRPGGTQEAADPIALHPPVQRILLDLRVWSEGMRAIAYWAAHQLDIAEHAPDEAERAQARAQAALLTPIIKSLFTERGFALASDALQVFGGYGYIHEYGIEQTVRDSRIPMIYEGTNQIQALDLLQRKALASPDALAPLLEVFDQEAAASASQPQAAPLAQALRHWCDKLQALTHTLHERAAQPDGPGAIATAAEDYLRLAGLVCLAWAWTRSARIAATQPAVPPQLAQAKQASASHFLHHILPEAAYRLHRIEAALAAPILCAPAPAPTAAGG